jgi:hypothetical protein
LVGDVGFKPLSVPTARPLSGRTVELALPSRRPRPLSGLWDGS